MLSLLNSLWGWAILIIIAAIYMDIIRPRLKSWAADHNFELLLDAVEQGVLGCWNKYTESYKAVAKDGKLTAEQSSFIMNECRSYVIEALKTQGISALKTYGAQVIDMLAEAKLAELKESSLKKSALLPLESLVVSPENFSLSTN